MGWSNSTQTFIWIFPVGRGNAVFLRTALNQGFIVDMGEGEDVDPAEFVREHFLPKLDEYKDHKIAQVILSHPHTDHIAQCGELAENTDEDATEDKGEGEDEDLYPTLLTCPNDKTEAEEVNWDRFSESGSEIRQTYRDLFAKRQPPLQTIDYDSVHKANDLEYGVYWVRPPVCDKLHPSDDNKYGNAISVMLYLRHGVHSILCPGDCTPEAMDLILDNADGSEKRFTQFHDAAPDDWHTATSDQPDLCDLLENDGLTVLMAPHHGLESCYSEKLYSTIRDGKPRLVIISERRLAKEGDGKTDDRYTNGSGGAGVSVEYEGEKAQKTYLTTKNGHHILCLFSGAGQPRIYADKDPTALLKVLDSL